MFPTARKDPRGGHNKAQINHDFFKSWSPQMAYVLGFIFADGAIEDVQKSSRTCYISLVNKDISLLKKIRQVMYKDLEKAPYLDRKYAIYQKWLQVRN